MGRVAYKTALIGAASIMLLIGCAGPSCIKPSYDSSGVSNNQIPDNVLSCDQLEFEIIRIRTLQKEEASRGAEGNIPLHPIGLLFASIASASDGQSIKAAEQRIKTLSELQADKGCAIPIEAARAKRVGNLIKKLNALSASAMNNAISLEEYDIKRNKLLENTGG